MSLSALCLFLGDSTAKGVALAYNRHAPSPCSIIARVGAGSAEISGWSPPAQVRMAILGIGSNNPTSPGLAADLRRTRANLHAERVIWMLPYHRRAAATVRRVAIIFGDYVIDLADLPSNDSLHPRNYAGIARALQHWPLR